MGSRGMSLPIVAGTCVGTEPGIWVPFLEMLCGARLLTEVACDRLQTQFSGLELYRDVISYILGTSERSRTNVMPRVPSESS